MSERRSNMLHFYDFLKPVKQEEINQWNYGENILTLKKTQRIL
jgi:hypothetical protein